MSGAKIIKRCMKSNRHYALSTIKRHALLLSAKIGDLKAQIDGELKSRYDSIDMS